MLDNNNDYDSVESNPVPTNISTSYDSHIDILTRERLRLWILNNDNLMERISIDIYIDNIFAGRFTAQDYRPDLLEAGKGDGRYGLDISIGPLTGLYNADSDLSVEIFVSAPVLLLIKSHRLVPEGLTIDDCDPVKLNWLSISLNPILISISNKMNKRSNQQRPPFVPSLAERICAPACTPEYQSPQNEGVLVSSYGDFVRYRYRVDTIFQPSEGQTESSHYMKWYLESYCPMRGEIRAPLASYEIDYLNEIIPVGGQKYHLSRATYMFLFDNPGLLAQLNLSDASSFLSIVYWWAIERARSLFVEDCLVPKSYRDLLVSVRGEWSKRRYPLSRFMEIYFSRNRNWHSLDLEIERDRILLYVALILTANNAPFILQYIPPSWLRKITNQTSTDGSVLSRVCELISTCTVISEYTFEDIIRAAGFDLYNLRSLAISPSRHRLHSASLPLPPEARNPRHVQIIGPMRLASGLGQAARLSASALEATGLSYSAHAFDLDNPAPQGFATATDVGELVRPGVNLLHLNAESIPLAFGYLPDAFSEAYNIGYFFWELDSPAKCHHLGVSMLDEIWVSSEYGAQIYSQYTDKPVINVGMAIENPEIPGLEESQLFLEQCTGIQPAEFTFMAAFDSFSFIQRKNPQAVVRAFKAAFSEGEAVRLVLKTHNRDFIEDPIQLRIWQALQDDIGSDPRIVLVNETLSYKELIRLKRGCDCYISLHRSEGWGFGMAEAMNLGVPVIATGYSGNIEFCKPTTCWLVDYELRHVQQNDYIFVTPGQRWAEPDVRHAAQQMKAVYDRPDERENRATAARSFIKQNFSATAVGARYAARLDQIFQTRKLPSARITEANGKAVRTKRKTGAGVRS